MSTAQVISPAPLATTVSNTLNGLTSMFSANGRKRHSISIPSSFSSTAYKVVSTYSTSTSTHSSLSNSSSLLPVVLRSNQPRKKRLSMSAAAEAAPATPVKGWKEQSCQIIQLSTVNDQGRFLPPTPNERGFKEDLKAQGEDGEDYFATIIINTPPERVKTLLSTESTISPGMFSLPAKVPLLERRQRGVKRHTISFPPSSTASISSSSLPSPATAAAAASTVSAIPTSKTMLVSTTLASIPTIPNRDLPQLQSQERHYTPPAPLFPPPQQSSPRAQSPARVQPLSQTQHSTNGRVKTRYDYTSHYSRRGSVHDATRGAFPSIQTSGSVLPTAANSLVTPPSSPPAIPIKNDAYFTARTTAARPVTPTTPNASALSLAQPETSDGGPPSPQMMADSIQDAQTTSVKSVRSKTRAQIKFLTGDKDAEDDISTLLIDPFASLLSSSPQDFLAEEHGDEQGDDLSRQLFQSSTSIRNRARGRSSTNNSSTSSTSSNGSDSFGAGYHHRTRGHSVSASSAMEGLVSSPSRRQSMSAAAMSSKDQIWKRNSKKLRTLNHLGGELLC